MMPDRGATRPYLVEQVRQAELDAKAAELTASSLGRANLNKALAALASAGTVLALADAEWAREDAAARQTQGVQVPPSPQPAAVQHTGKPIY